MKSKNAPKIAVVTPWWGRGAIGGAEFLAGEIARRFLGRGYEVEILTTCGQSAFADWSEDYYEPGRVSENGLTTRRFPLDPREQDRFVQCHQALMAGRFLSPAEERDFFTNNINSRALCAYIEANRDDCLFLFLPYLYGTTYYGLRAARGRGILIPCLHDESVAYMQNVRKMMESAAGIWFLTEPEYRFANSLYKLQDVKTAVVGVGMDHCLDGDGEAFRRKHGITGPYVLFAGRRVPGKGYDTVVDCFTKFCSKRPDWSLVVAGLGDVDKPEGLSGRVLDVGCLERQGLWDAMAGATVFCQPSRYESFSYVLMEAWCQQTPALVNAECEVLRWQCEVAGGGLWFHGPDEFERALLYLERSPGDAHAMGRQGREYVQRNLRWEDTLNRADALLCACGLI